ncbi:hypothetical protein CLV56_3409 [Mumia flava]|uniref:Uncharacterized protein n=1 Tax=Mumia flava TaxID=1348852 RepID=A0A0B2B6Z3_9ACTN|nr:hypothetical protein [Mumia flava]PJJ53907.1 hypothetical protein CLV56_3409 [Mumia flava]
MFKTEGRPWSRTLLFASAWTLGSTVLYAWAVGSEALSIALLFVVANPVGYALVGFGQILALLAGTLADEVGLSAPGTLPWPWGYLLLVIAPGMFVQGLIWGAVIEGLRGWCCRSATG